MMLISSIRREPIEGYPHYFAGFDGYVYREDCTINGKKFYKRKFNESPTTYAYQIVLLRNEHTIEQVPLHRVICRTYHPNPYNLPVVNHRDENILNNAPTNLEWCTTSWNNKWTAIMYQKKLDSIEIGAPYFIKRLSKVLRVISKEGRYLLMNDQQYYFLEEIILP